MATCSYTRCRAPWALEPPLLMVYVSISATLVLACFSVHYQFILHPQVKWSFYLSEGTGASICSFSRCRTITVRIDYFTSVLGTQLPDATSSNREITHHEKQRETSVFWWGLDRDRDRLRNPLNLIQVYSDRDATYVGGQEKNNKSLSANAVRHVFLA
ncbi:hypothetical protein IW262DRAFT_1081587 [Armillaria fumosa]|nr:hypothetical protein IW262DRAFT_1081587 [Armillaria fumosa]